jgi:colanic acid/amylovoran biosynthesis glycosyltransferase
MRIAIITSEFPKTSETFVIDHVASLIDLGHDVSVFAFKSNPGACHHQAVGERNLASLVHLLDPFFSDTKTYRVLQRLKSLVFESWREPTVAIRSLDPRIGGRAAAKLSVYLASRAFHKQRNFDIVHCHFGWSGVAGARLKKIKALFGKLIITFHGADVNAAWGIGTSRERKLMFDNSDWFTGNTAFTLNQAIELGCPGDRCSIWHMGVDTKLFSFRERRLADGEPIRLLTVGRLIEKKGVEYVIRALPWVKSGGREIEYHIIGDGPLLGELQQLARDLGVGARVIFHGERSSQIVRQYYDRCHIFVLASVRASNGDREGQPVVLIEAQACGLPVISTNHAGIPEAVLDCESAYLVPERDVKALADRLNYLANNSQQWGKMGRAGRQFVERDYALEHCTNAITSLYEKLLYPRTSE